MAEAAEGTKSKKTEVTPVTMEDGRVVGFAGNRRMVKETIVDEGKIIVDGDTVTLSEGAVKVRLNFRNGKVIVHTPKPSLVPKYVGHGAEQKLGDETAGEKDVDDMVLAVEDLDKRLAAGEWNVQRESGGFSGASVVIRAIMEASGKTMEDVKAFLQKKLDDAEARGEKLTRAALYASFRNPKSKTGQIIRRLEEEKAAKDSAVDADAELAALQNA